MQLRLKRLKRVVVRGKVYFYHQRTFERLPDDPILRAERLLEINAGAVRREVGEGSMADLVVHYKQSPEFRALSEKTRADYLRYLDFFHEVYGDLLVANADKEWVLELRNEWQDKPRAADYRIAVLRRLFSHALNFPKRFALTSNPAARVTRLHSTDGYAPWPDTLIEAVLSEVAKNGSDRKPEVYPDLVDVVVGGLFSGQRESDVVRMAWSHYDGHSIEVAQQKVRNTRLTIPAHYRLREVLDRRKCTSASVVIFTTKTGRPWQVDHLRHEIAAMTAALGHPGLSYHGLRKRQTDMLFEVGCTEKEVSSILGWRTLQMAAHYSRRADQKRLAQAAIRKLEKVDRRNDRTLKQKGIKIGKHR